MKEKLLYPRAGVILVAILVLAIPIQTFAGLAVIGLVVGGRNATIGDQPILPSTTLLSGDALQVSDGTAVVVLRSGVRLTFGKSTSASFQSERDEIAVLLSEGYVAMHQAEDRTTLRFKVGNMSVIKPKGFRTSGEVAILNGELVVRVKEGSLRLEGNGLAMNVPQGKTVSIPANSDPSSPAGPHKSNRSLRTGLIAGASAAGASAAAVKLDNKLDKEALQVACEVGKGENIIASHMEGSPFQPFKPPPACL